jgi:hypothetical protein
MALSKSTPTPKNRPTLLSRRITKGTPTFRSIPAVWSCSQDSSPCIAFDVTWDDVPKGANELQGYSVRVLLTDDVGGLALVAQPAHAGGCLQLVNLDQKGYFRDPRTSKIIPHDGWTVLGKVVEEREYVLPDIPKEPTYPLRGSQIKGLTRLIDCGIAAVMDEAKDDVAIDNIHATSIAVADSAGYQLIRDQFRSHDPEDPKWIAGKPNASDPDDIDHALRFAFAMMLRAGQFIGAGNPTSRLVAAR